MASKMNQMRVQELLLEALETERGGIQVYETALECVEHAELRQEFEKYLEQTREHERTVEALLGELGIDPETDTPGREVVRRIGQGLVEAMRFAQGAGSSEAAEIVAAECVVLAETKDHLNWELIGELAKSAPREERSAMRAAHERVEEQEDEHLYHSSGWARELWLSSLGLAAVLPPPEEEKDVKTAIGAARAKQQREELL